MTISAATAGPRSGLAADRDAAIRQYAPLVKYVVGRLAIGRPAILDYEDILSYGTIGLIEALDRFDDTRAVKFETYAITRIRGSIIDALRALDRLPRSVRQKGKKLEQLRASLTVDLGREPTAHELAEAMGMSIDQYHRALVDCGWVTVSLDGLLDRDAQGEGTGLGEMPADPNEDDFTQGLEKQQMVGALAGALKLLPEREWLILSLYYKEEMTRREIARILDVSESRVCQLHTRALGRLRTRLERDRAA
ncbi:MAG: sigma-70 family RNA polymerase sigma factor [Tepidiformaceae bacterium]